MFRRKKDKEIEFNTTALPDIIFMLLFFFMVVTVMKDDSDALEIKIPKIEYAEDLKKHKAFLELALMKSNSGDNLYILENKKYIHVEDFTSAITNYVHSHEFKNELKAKVVCDRNIKMKEINEIKRCLQKNLIYKVDYITKKK